MTAPPAAAQPLVNPLNVVVPTSTLGGGTYFIEINHGDNNPSQLPVTLDFVAPVAPVIGWTGSSLLLSGSLALNVLLHTSPGFYPNNAYTLEGNGTTSIPYNMDVIVYNEITYDLSTEGPIVQTEILPPSVPVTISFPNGLPPGFTFDNTTNILTIDLSLQIAGQVIPDMRATFNDGTGRISNTGYDQQFYGTYPTLQGIPETRDFVGGNFSIEACSNSSVLGNKANLLITGQETDKIFIANKLVCVLEFIIKNRLITNYTAPIIDVLNYNNVFYDETGTFSTTTSLANTIDFFLNIGEPEEITDPTEIALITYVVTTYFNQYHSFLNSLYGSSSSSAELCDTGNGSGNKYCKTDCFSSINILFRVL